MFTLRTLPPAFTHVYVYVYRTWLPVSPFRVTRVLRSSRLFTHRLLLRYIRYLPLRSTCLYHSRCYTRGTRYPTLRLFDLRSPVTPAHALPFGCVYTRGCYRTFHIPLFYVWFTTTFSPDFLRLVSFYVRSLRCDYTLLPHTVVYVYGCHGCHYRVLRAVGYRLPLPLYTFTTTFTVCYYYGCVCHTLPLRLIRCLHTFGHGLPHTACGYCSV